jgi:hypothetical protein
VGHVARPHHPGVEPARHLVQLLRGHDRRVFFGVVSRLSAKLEWTLEMESNWTFLDYVLQEEETCDDLKLFSTSFYVNRS